ncbi:MAG: 3-hydroxyacyl-ACP dehydratase FabZ [Alphaproteobacteria bacterium]|jgi:3-hydroxyacyl-[acyl-carrier-protein] dehydratase|nr:3-hydroxyacyl-ACP dehydratase FabZ [Alphaproteobacteria bacterium]
MTTVKYDIEGIKKLVPHRYPFLLIDKVEITERGVSATGTKCVTANEEVFNGHFPGRATFPGFLMLEALAQTAVCVGKDVMENPDDTLILLAGTDKAKFKRQVVPGDVLKLHVEIITEKGPMSKFKCWGEVDGELCVSCELSAMKVPMKK